MKGKWAVGAKSSSRSSNWETLRIRKSFTVREGQDVFIETPAMWEKTPPLNRGRCSCGTVTRRFLASLECEEKEKVLADPETLKKIGNLEKCNEGY